MLENIQRLQQPTMLDHKKKHNLKMMGNLCDIFTLPGPTHLPGSAAVLKTTDCILSVGFWLGNGGSKADIILKNCGCLFCPVWATWIMTEVCVIVSSNRILPVQKNNYVEDSCWKHCKTNEQHIVTCRRLQLKQIIDMQEPGRKSWWESFFGKSGNWKAPAYTREFGKSHSSAEKETCSEKTWEDPKLSPQAK